MATSEQLCRAFIANHEDFERVLLSAHVNDAGEARVAALLLTTIVEMHGAVGVLARAEYLSHAPVLCRSMMEAFASLSRLVSEPDYVDQIVFDDAVQAMKVVDEFRDDPELVADESMLAQVRAIAGTYQQTRDDLRGKGFKQETIECRLQRAGLSRMYAGYRAMCAFTHNNLATLKSRHLGEAKLLYRAPSPTELWPMVLGLATSICAQSVRLAPHFTNLLEADLKPILSVVDWRWDFAADAS